VTAKALSPHWTVVVRWSNPLLLDLLCAGHDRVDVTVHITYSLSTDRKTLTQRGVYSSNGLMEKRVFYR
jgi:hypothetical protein